MVAGALTAVALSCRAEAVQILVQPGDNWSLPAGRVKAGDEIVLMPGTHVCATLDGLSGRSDAPIVIRPLDAKHKVVIEGGREGLRLRRPQFVEIRDLTIRGPTLAGVMLTNDEGFVQPGSKAATETPTDDESPEWGNLILERVRVENVGPKGQRHGFLIKGVRNVRLDRCTVTGWGGSAVELVSVQEATINECTFTGEPGYTQMHGLRARAGSRQIDVNKCHFIDAGSIVLGFGGSSHREEFASPANDAAAADNPRGAAAEIPIEINGMQVNRCLIVGGGTAIDLRAAQACAVRNSTIVRPRGPVLWTDALVSQKVRGSESPDRSLFNTISNNIIQWNERDVPKLMEASQTVDPVMVQFEQNLWWAAPQEPEGKKRPRATDRTLTGTILFPQEMTMDPLLDDFYKPANIDAQVFGAYGP